MKHRRDLVEQIANLNAESVRIDPRNSNELYTRVTITISALQNRLKYFESFLIKANYIPSNASFSDHFGDFTDTSHFEIYNAQLIWNIFNRDIVFKFVDELFVQQKKWFSQSRRGLMLSRKMVSYTQNHSIRSDSDVNIPISGQASPYLNSQRSGSFCVSPTDTIDAFFQSLLERSVPVSPSSPAGNNGPFVAIPEPVDFKNETYNRNDSDMRSPIYLRTADSVSIPRLVDVNFFNPQLCFLTPTHSPSGAILITAHQAKVEFSSIWNRKLDAKNKFENRQQLDAKIGTRTKISLLNSSLFATSSINFLLWPSDFLKKCYTQDSHAISKILRRITEDSDTSLVYDVSNIGYLYTADSPKLEMFGRGDLIKFLSSGVVLTTTSEQFRIFLDVIMNLLVYRDKNQEIRSEELEKLLVAANLNDRRMIAQKMLEYRIRLDQSRQVLLLNEKFRSHSEIEDLLEAFDKCEREMAMIGEAMRMIIANSEKLSQKRTRLNLQVLVDQIQWNLITPRNEPTLDILYDPLCAISLQKINNRWISKEDGSMENSFEIGSALFLNQTPNPFYHNVLRPVDLKHSTLPLKATVNYGCLIRFYAKSRLPVNSVIILDHVELDISPLQIQLTLDIATQLVKYFLPENSSRLQNKPSTSGRPVRTSSNSTSDSVTGNLSRRASFVQSTSVGLTSNSTYDPPFGEGLSTKKPSEQSVFFVYVKVPPSQHIVSYKGNGRSSIVDIDKFILSLPEMEYQNKLWSWPEFFNQLRKDTIILLLKNAGSLLKDKLKKLGQKNTPEGIEDAIEHEDDKLEVYETESIDDEKQKNFLLFGKSLLKLMKKKF